MPTKPTVGRIVHYYGRDGRGPIAAIVTDVGYPGPMGYEACLTLFRIEGATAATWVPYADAPNIPDIHYVTDYWVWPPRAE